ncbi:hypothetical protein E3Q22_02176 [Wallemia mellicola]|uniref:Type 1 phosphatases regulator n=1 Tax=Wallemia mellicola TaxID=1708541 RepID=A0A4T0SWU1_9BASI|nr:hypothetical protein E3Q22_02176 [Wallemia mellicola]TIB91985.1 hypothetical protein E3Q19_02162 [Wallemia mellicola]TIC11927.1 hypothetical protein E3Q14_02021 [Wallemia mellicola]TIC14067.1 hypothetical protein E3Q15_01817 [Wallemia mellicola]TIC56882.1 hypothetical protein E3Q05_01537 [Wallemia mellicola]
MQSERSRTDDGSSSQTIERSNSRQQQTHVLKLRGHQPEQRSAVRWEEGTVDNENMNKKKSKICCIYHKPKRFDESSDESDCSDSEHKPCTSKSNKYDNPSHSHSHPGRSTVFFFLSTLFY